MVREPGSHPPRHPRPGDDYRVREARVEINDRIVRRFLAERRILVFGLLPLWWPVTNGNWRHTVRQAEQDAENDAALRAPLAQPKPFTPGGTDG